MALSDLSVNEGLNTKQEQEREREGEREKEREKSEGIAQVVI